MAIVARYEMKPSNTPFYESICRLNMMGFFRKNFNFSFFIKPYFWSIISNIDKKIHLLVKNSISNLWKSSV
ncbi:hypothetical protein D8N35_11980 [Enterococcus casseliflavus]|nr:hypothetical protein D8N35_11980 [Enterococcus casseliflavus]